MINAQQKLLVSIGLPTYNRAHCITHALDALLCQTYQNFELIISDNASDDSTRQICEAYAKKDTRIKYFRQKENMGFMKNFLFVLHEARGEYFIWVADDDWWAPNYLEALTKALLENPSYGVSMCSFQRILENGTIYDEFLLKGAYDVTFDKPFTLYKKLFCSGAPLNHFIYGLFRRELLLRLLRHPMPECPSWEKIFISELALVTPFYCVPAMLRFNQRRRKTPQSAKIRYHPIRYPGDAPKPVWFLPTAYTKLLARSFVRIIKSSAVPMKRKLSVIVPLLSVIWSQRQRFIGFSLRDFERFWHNRKPKKWNFDNFNASDKVK